MSLNRNRLLVTTLVGSLLILATVTLPAASSGADPSAPPTLAMFGLQVSEGPAGNRAVPVTLRLSRPIGADLLVGYSITGSTATSPSDFKAKTGTVKIKAGKVGAYINVTIVGDDVAEPTENVSVALTSVNQPGVALGPGGSVTINDDDVNASPRVMAGFAGMVEGDEGFFNLKIPIILTQPVAQDVVLSYTTNEGNATPGVDYKSKSGTVTIKAGKSVANVSIKVFGDGTNEGGGVDAFGLYLSPGPGFPAGVSITNGVCLCLIQHDD